MNRAASWEASLSAFMRGALQAEFAWGRLDCCLWAASWVEICCGWHPAKDLIGRYTSARGAARIIRGEGGFIPMLDRRLGRAPMQTAFMASRGDLACVPGAAGLDKALGVVLGRKVAILTPQGLYQTPIHNATHAWRIG